MSELALLAAWIGARGALGQVAYIYGSRRIFWNMCYKIPSLADIPLKKGFVYEGGGSLVVYRPVSEPFFGGYSAEEGIC